MKRLTWLVGPPGAGKTTFTATLPKETRSVELTDMLGPLVNPVRMRKGILRANGMLVKVIRHLELHPDHRDLPGLLVVAGLVSAEDLFPLSADEEVWLLLPPRELWMTQLRCRPVGGASSGQYDDYGYAAQWYDRFTDWVERDLPCRLVTVPYDTSLLGKIAGGSGSGVQ